MVGLNSNIFYIILLLCVLLFGRHTNSLQMKGIEGKRSIKKHSNTKLDEDIKGLSFIKKEDTSSEIMLLSRGKPARQSTNYTVDNAPAYLAVDGDLNNNARKSNGCSHTQPGKDYPWFLVDLEEEAIIDRIDIYNRMDCCSERLHKFIVYVSNTDNPKEFTKSLTCGSEYSGNLKNTPKHSVSCDNKVGRYVIVYINDKKSILSICELEVFGKYVDKCKNGTHNCKHNEICKSNIKGGFTCQSQSSLSTHVNINIY